MEVILREDVSNLGAMGDIVKVKPGYANFVAEAQGALRVAGASIPYQRLLILFVAAAMLVFVWFLLYRTRLGLAMRACANDLEVAALMGMNVNRVAMWTVATSVALAAIAGVVAGTPGTRARAAHGDRGRFRRASRRAIIDVTIRAKARPLQISSRASPYPPTRRALPRFHRH